MGRKISYVNKNYTDFREALKEYTKQYYPELSDSLDDASVGSWLLDIVAGVSDSLSYHIDRAFQETNIDNAQNLSSLYNIAKSNGIKIPGPKGSVTEMKLTCILPINTEIENSSATSKLPQWAMAPVVKRGTRFSGGDVIFELDHDIDFSQAFDFNGIPNRTIEVIKDSNSNPTAFRVSKTFLVNAGITKIYKYEITKNDIKPFMEVLLPYNNILGVESIIFKEGINLESQPSLKDFMMESEYISANGEGTQDTYRFFEVDSLIQQYRWGKQIDSENNPQVDTYGYVNDNGEVIPTAIITRGEWKPLRQKFITEFTEKGYLKITFGAGHRYFEDYTIGNNASYNRHLISKLINNESLGVLPKVGTTMYILYRVGGGKNSNVPIGSINKIDDLKLEVKSTNYNDRAGLIYETIKRSFTVTNTTESISGRDALTGEELKNYIKYNKGAQDRCVTINDYKSRILQMPSLYGTPYRVGVREENNKVMVFLLGLDYNGKLTPALPTAFINNLKSYLSEYRMLNDFVEAKAGKIVNVSFEIDCYVNKSYNSANVVTTIIDKVKNYMAIDSHQMGDDIFLGDLEREISAIDGVKNLIDLRVYNEFGPNYSKNKTTQKTFDKTQCYGAENEEISSSRNQINLEASDHILYSESDTMIEVRYPEKDIKVRVKLK